ncbi:MAG: hypothetical protein PHZ19_03635 [Candidatus Thermoplasmatota archaeon]|nr:hypothetical protein [Candidatus Thermoplasmatota archaeon]
MGVERSILTEILRFKNIGGLSAEKLTDVLKLPKERVQKALMRMSSVLYVERKIANEISYWHITANGEKALQDGTECECGVLCANLQGLNRHRASHSNTLKSMDSAGDARNAATEATVPPLRRDALIDKCLESLTPGLGSTVEEVKDYIVTTYLVENLGIDWMTSKGLLRE